MYTEDRDIIETQEYLKVLFDYDPEGFLVWKKRPDTYYKSNNHKQIVESRSVGNRANTLKKYYSKGEKQYYIVSIHKKSCRCARLIWIWHYGRIPEGMEIDHIDRISTNDKIENLRLATSSQNKLNREVFKNNALGERNIGKKGNKFRVSVIREFDTIEEAIRWRDLSLAPDFEWVP